MGGRPTTKGVQAAPVTNWTQVAVAVFVLVLGTLVYVLDRSSESVPFFSAVSLAHLLPGLFGRIGESLPTFSHVFAFSLLTAAWFGGGRNTGLAACLVWFGVDAAFEVGQHPQIAPELAQLVPAWFDSLPILSQSGGYFLLGTFDAWDLTSIAMGAGTAYVFISWISSRD